MNDFVDIHEAAHRIGEQAQYVARYATTLGYDLRFRGDPRDYRGLKIHRDDLDEFVRRVVAHRRALGV